jgi:hypothetical protein
MVRKECFGMKKTFKKILGRKARKLFVIAIGALIAAGFSACGIIQVRSGPSEEEQAVQDTLDSASWEVKILDTPPSLAGFEKVSGFGAEMAFFQRSAGRLGLGGAGKWYVLTAPELPGTTYYYYIQGVKDTGGSLSIANIYKNKQ